MSTTTISARAVQGADRHDRAATGARVADELRRRGVVVLADTAVGADVVSAAFGVARESFALPAQVKENYRARDGAGQRGYTGFGPEQAIGDGAPDPKEFWHVGRGGSVESRYGENIWPDEVPGFRPTVEALFQACDQALQDFVALLDPLLGAEPGGFTELVRDGNAVIRLLHYPPGPPDALDRDRAAPHTDIDLFTVWIGATEGGLRFEDDGTWWAPEAPSPGSLVIAAGEMLEHLTRGAVRAVRHRVVASEGASRSRYSMVYLVHPRPDTVLVPVNGLQDGERAFTANEYLHERIRYWGRVHAGAHTTDEGEA